MLGDLLNILLVTSVAQDRHHPGDWWFPGEEAWWCGCSLHRPAHARLPGKQTGHRQRRIRDTTSSSFAPFVPTQPPQFKLDPRLARMLGIHTQTRPVIIQALWQYVKTHKLQDPHEREFINCDKYLQQVSGSNALSDLLQTLSSSHRVHQSLPSVL